MATRSARLVDSSFAQRCRVKRSLAETSTSRRAWWPIAAFTSQVNCLPANLERPVIEERLSHLASIRSRRPGRRRASVWSINPAEPHCHTAGRVELRAGSAGPRSRRAAAALAASAIAREVLQ